MHAYASNTQATEGSANGEYAQREEFCIALSTLPLGILLTVFCANTVMDPFIMPVHISTMPTGFTSGLMYSLLNQPDPLPIQNQNPVG